MSESVEPSSSKVDDLSAGSMSETAEPVIETPPDSATPSPSAAVTMETPPESTQTSPQLARANSTNSTEEQAGDGVTEEMRAEEAKLHAETMREEEERRKEQEQELHRMNSDLREERYRRLQFLLTKSNMYTHYLLKRMNEQKELEEERQRRKEAKRQRDAATAAETAQSEADGESEAAAESSSPTQLAAGSSQEGSPVHAQGRRTSGRVLTPAPQGGPRKSPRGGSGPVLSPRGSTQTTPSTNTDKPKRGRKRKAEAESFKITDMFAEALERNKKRKTEESSKENSNPKENEKTEVKEEVKQEVAADGGGRRVIGGEVVDEAQPHLFTGGVLRDYQIDGYKWLKTLYENGVNGILADEMGLGKTIQCIAVIANLIYKGLPGPYLVVGPLSTVPNWVAEFQNFAPKVPVLLYHGSQQERSQKRGQFTKRYPIREGVYAHNVVVTSYEIAMNDRKYIGTFDWKYLIVDEGHRIKNFQCKLIKELRVYKSTHRLLLTGTPLQNNLQELWSLLNFLLPEIFDDLGSFEAWFDISFLESDSSNDAIVKEEQKDSILTILHQILSPFMLRRMKADVALNIPPKREVLVYAPLSTTQTSQYRSIVDRTIRKLVEGDEEKERAAFEFDQHGRSKRRRRSRFSQGQLDAMMQLENGEVQDDDDDEDEVEEWFSNVGDTGDDTNNNSVKQREPKTRALNIQLRNVMTMFRKCVNHPYLIDYPLDESGQYKVDQELLGASGKLLLLDRMLARLKATGHKVLIFSQMTKILDILEDYCYLRKYQYCRLDGTMKIEDRRDQIAAFNTEPERFVFLLSTRAGGLGINLTAADTVVIYDSDWNPQADLQAQDRAHRIGQRRPVVVYRLVTAGTIDQKIVERAAAKRKLEKMVITKGKFISGGCWTDEAAAAAAGDENYDPVARAREKVSSAMNPTELLQMLQATDFDHKVECGGGAEQQVITDADLERLLDRSDLLALMEQRKDAQDPKRKERREREKARKGFDKFEDIKGVFKVVDTDIGGTSLFEHKEIAK